MSSEEIAKRIIASSGNSFHARVASWLKQDGWHVLVSPYYMDTSQGKAREIDLIAERVISVEDDFGRQAGSVVVRMYIECKFVSTHTVFWFAEKDKEAANDLVCRSGVFRERNSYTNEHHYLSTCSQVAKVFSTESKTQEQEPFYKALNQVLSAYVSMDSRPATSPEFRYGRDSANIILNYPVVVCSDFSRLFQTEFFQPTEPRSITDSFQLEVRYAYSDPSGSNRDDYFLIDFVDYENLIELCGRITRNGEVAAFFCQP